MAARETKYTEPGFFTKHVFNRAVALLAKAGISLAGSRTLTVAGRTSGEPRTTPVNPLEIAGHTYLVSPRGTTQWVRNLRAAGEGELKLGRTTRRFRGEEVPDSEKLPILKAYLDKWAWEVGTFFELPKDPSDAQIQEIAHLHPIFRVRYPD
ncbi:MAG TPA: nitroreductase family deazaflavin-dependent oxidoreductase [Solirubrobacterales bacterium]|nr:nitroreductase family deazaflavin-dependent oxidoreductase [Solirubrobacterales bacterium]